MNTYDNLNLYTKKYLVTQPKANLVLIHGLGEYSERYIHVIEALNTINISVYTLDLRGHGHSEGERAFVKDIEEFRKDIEQFISDIPKNLPLFILGHSMGGLIVADYLLHEKRNFIKAVILSGAALEVGADISPISQFIIKLLAGITPKLKTVKLDPKSISRDAETVEKYTTDPLIYHDGAKAAMGAALLSAIKNVKTKFANFDYPVLIMHGGADKITNPEGSKALYTQSKSIDKTLKIWDGAYHEIFNETNRKEVINYMIEWLQKQQSYLKL